MKNDLLGVGPSLERVETDQRANEPVAARVTAQQDGRCEEVLLTYRILWSWNDDSCDIQDGDELTTVEKAPMHHWLVDALWNLLQPLVLRHHPCPQGAEQRQRHDVSSVNEPSGHPPVGRVWKPEFTKTVERHH